jgi:hypothetical protein
MLGRVQECYPTCGHSHKVCDRNFGIVKRLLREELTVCIEYVEVIVNAS